MLIIGTPVCGAFVSKIEIEVAALRYFVTRLAAELISMHAAPEKNFLNYERNMKH